MSKRSASPSSSSNHPRPGSPVPDAPETAPADSSLPSWLPYAAAGAAALYLLLRR